MQRQAEQTLSRPDAADMSGSILPGEAKTIDVIRRWLELSELERRAFGALARELSASSDLVEHSTGDLSERFQALASIAQAQTGRVARIIEVSETVTVAGEAVPLGEAMQAVESVLLKVVDTILSISKHAMRMVYALNDVARDVESAEGCASQIEKINRQTSYLALNAAIEASRSGAAGAAFGVIAYEMKELSLATAATSRQVRERMSAVAVGVRKGQSVLQEIATLDMSEHIVAKQQIDGLIAGVIAQNQAFNAVLAEAADTSADMARTISNLITGMQFQDRTKQHIGHVVDTLGVLADNATAAQNATLEAFPGVFERGGIDESQILRIIENQTLGAVKQRLLTRLLSDGGPLDGNDPQAEEADDPDSAVAGEVELF
jgi:methyl-accepting chemotaxis protein